MPTVALDLSPFYLQAARENVEYWRRMVKREDAAPTSFIHAAAESIPLGPESCDVVRAGSLSHLLLAVHCVLGSLTGSVEGKGQ